MTFNGKPVTAGTLVLSPDTKEKEPGAPASIPIQADGTFSSRNVPVGLCKVIYMAPSPAFPEGYVPKPSEPAPVSPYAALAAKTSETTINSGSNTLDIELGPAAPRPK